MKKLRTQTRTAALAALCASVLCHTVSANDQALKVPRPLPLMKSDKVPTPAPAKSSVEPRALQGAAPLPQAPPVTGHALPRKGLPPNAPLKTPPAIDRERVFLDEVNGVVWARGRDWKASFDGSAATFIPFLGSNAPQDYPVSFSVARLSVGGDDVALWSQGAVSQGANEVTIERGGLTERYDLAPGSVEQSFVVQSLPHGGDLSVKLSVESELGAFATAAGIEFKNDLGSVRYGRATVVDKNGASLDAATCLVEGGVEIDVPAAALARAAFPITIDPVITTFTLANSGLDQFSPDIAYDAGLDRFCAIYEEEFSAADHDVYSMLFDSNGAPLGLDVYIDYTTDYWSSPKVACNGLWNNFLVVASVRQIPSQPNYIAGRVRSSSTTNMSPQFAISGGEFGVKIFPDVGGDPVTVGPTYYCVVWEREFSDTDTDIHARLVNPDGTLYGPGTILLEDSSGTRDFKPSISKSDGNAPFSSQEWTVAFGRYFPTTQESDPMFAQIHWDGGITTYTHDIDSSTANDLDVCVSSEMDGDDGPRPSLVVWSRYVSGLRRDLVGAVTMGGVVQTEADLNLIQSVPSMQDRSLPSADCDGSMFSVAFGEAYSTSTTDYDIYVASYFYASGALYIGDDPNIVDYSVLPSYWSQICAQRSGGATTHRYGLVWLNVTTPSNEDVYAGIYDGPASGPSFGYCSGDGSGTACPCGNSGASGNGCANSINSNGAHLSASGLAKTLNDTAVLTGSGMPAVAPCLFFQGTGASAGTVFGDGLRCVNGSVLRLGTKVCNGGVAVYPEAGDASISQKGLLPAIGGNRYYQAWYRNSDPTFCSASTFNLTNGWCLQWLP